MNMPRLKVCCIASVAEADLAIRQGASALGLVSEMPSGPGVVDWDTIAEIAATVPPGVATFLLTSSQDAAEIIEQQRRCGTTAVQIVDRLERGSYRDLRRALPGIGIVQVIHVVDQTAVPEACRVAPSVDALLLDSGNPMAAIKTLGGTGQVHDWSHSRAIVEQAGKPVYLAGGMNPDNVASAIQRVRPFGIDVCSGLRRDGALDPQRLAAFVAQMRVTVTDH